MRRVTPVILAAAAFLDPTLGPLFAWLVGHGPLGQAVTEPRIFAYGIAVLGSKS